MDIDLRDREISRLCFSAAEINEEEATVASAVSVLLADHNQIYHVSGLDGVFVNLTELRLSHNQLGHASTPYYRINHSVLGHFSSSASSSSNDSAPWNGCYYCDGVASWIRALPPTLEVLDVAYNHIHSFLECTCACANTAVEQQHVTEKPSSHEGVTELAVRALRHSCPFAVPLFFDSGRFPHLRELYLSHNAFAVSLRESDEMQSCFESYTAALAAGGVAAAVATSESLAMLDLSFNEGVAAVNSFFFSPFNFTENAEGLITASGEGALLHTPTCVVNVANTSIEDLQGIAAIGLYCSTARWSLRLHPSPLSRSVLTATPAVLVELLRMVVRTLEITNNVAAQLLKPTSSPSRDFASAMDSFESAAQLAELEELVRAELGRVAPHMEHACSSHSERWVATLAYVCLLHQVIPSLKTVDNTLSVSCCEEVLVTSLKRQLLMAELPSPRSSTSRLPLPAGAPPLHPPPLPPPLRGLGSAASAVAPELRSRVVVHDVNTKSDAKLAFSGSDSVESEVAASADGNGIRPGRFQAALAALRPSRSASTTPATTRTSSTHSVASVSPHSSSEVDGTHAQGSDVDFFTPSGLSAEERRVYETLCREAAELQAAMLVTNKRCRDFRIQTETLRQQLTQDRILVADQLREITRLREEKGQLEQSVERQRRRLEKRQKEVAYGVSAIQSREAAAREKAAMERIAAREREVARREKQLRQRTARAGALAVEFHSGGPTGQRRKLRSEVLREAAVRKRLAEQENKDPLAYSPASFKADARRATPRTSPDERAVLSAQGAVPTAVAEEERAYFELYGPLTAPGLQEVADRYVAHLSPPQQQQLREASTHLLSSGSRDASNAHHPRSRGSSVQCRASSLGSGGSPWSDDAARGTQRGGLVATSPEGGRDLSTLSLSELLDAAAAIRQKQIALQQLHRQWKQPLQPAPRSPPDHASASPSENLQAMRVASQLLTSGGDADDDGHKSKSASLEVPGREGGKESIQTVEVDRDKHDNEERGNSPFCSALAEEPQPKNAQQLFDMVLARRCSSKSGGKDDGNRGGEQAVPPTRSPFSTQQGLEEDSPGGTTDGTYDTPKNVAGTRPQINRALFR